ncbi:MAG: peptidoglycan editing factor PgeF [Deltaproteobacteria bacterium]|nr:peptidoglycan editing factor PgeF [Deltaproteobacteria bacterium]
MPLFQFSVLSPCEGLNHAVFTRHGGVSRPPFHTLNTAFGNGDDPGRVRENLRRIKDILHARALAFMDQVHGKEILVLKGKATRAPLPEPLQGDALITDGEGIALMVKQADCQAVLLYDPSRRVIANVHCGWRGNRQNILGAVVETMRKEFGCNPAEILAGIGPSLGPCCAEFVTHEEIFPKEFRPFMVRENYFNLWEISRFQLIEAGLEENHIEVAGLCTRCRTDLFFSYRGEGTTGRFATLIMLKDL